MTPICAKPLAPPPPSASAITGSRAWMGVVLGGIFGNLADRIFRSPGGLQGEVVDWIQIPNWPVFNIADTAVVSAAILITVLSAKNIDFYGKSKIREGNSDE